MGNQWKVADYTGCQQQFIVQHPAHFWPFLKALAEKLMPDSQISFKSWLNIVDSKLCFFFFQNQRYGGLKKLVLRLLQLLRNLEQS